jgi:hypothetical protein
MKHLWLGFGKLIIGGYICLSLWRPMPASATGLDDALTIYNAGQYNQARSAFLVLAQDSSQTSASQISSAKYLAAKCLFMMGNYTGYSSETLTQAIICLVSR